MTVATKNEIEIVGRERLTPALEVAKKFVAKSMSRPALTHVALMANGDLQATDSHKAIILKNIHSYSEQVLLNPKTLDLVKGYNWPELSNVSAFAEKNLQATLTFKRNRLTELLQALKFFKINKYQEADITFGTDEIVVSNPFISITVKNEDSWTFEQLSSETKLKARFLSGFLPTAFESFLSFSNLEEITVQYQGPMRPLVFDNTDMTIVTLPIRTY